MKTLGSTLLAALAATALHAGPYAPAAGEPGSTAIASTDNRFVAWATGYTNLTYGAEVSENFRTPEKALGPATTPEERDAFDIVCLGRNGQITLTFDRPIVNAPGADFAVFENGINTYFLELAFVEVSSDGVNYVRFPNDSLTPNSVPAFPTAFNGVDSTNLNGLAGKYEIGYGTPFDLADLPQSAELDLRNIRYVRIVDIVGDGNAFDTSGDPIYDPYPTGGSAGFDLDAVGVINEKQPAAPEVVSTRLENNQLVLEWRAESGANVVIEQSSDLSQWQTYATAIGSGNVSTTRVSYAPTANLFVRVRPQ